MKYPIALLLSVMIYSGVSSASEPDVVSQCIQLEQEYAAELNLPAGTASGDYQQSSFLEYCESQLIGSQEAVGNADSWESEVGLPQYKHLGKNRNWRVAHGTRLNVSVVPFEGTTPFVKSTELMSIDGPAGSCSIEMNVYKKRINSAGDRAILLVHGGGLIWRSKNLTTMRSMIPHLTERGFTVFETTYPLLANFDEPVSCQFSSYDKIIGSAESAFTWVQKNRGLFGAANGRISLMGFSAGGMIAGTLATRHAAQVDRIVNMYGPTELLHFVEEVQPGGLYEDGRYGFSEFIMGMIVGEPLRGIDMSNLPAVVTENSWSLNQLPPYFTILGNVDQTIPPTQVGITCAANPDATGEAGYFSCGNDSYAILLDDTKHLVDLKCDSDAWIFHAQDLGLESWHEICPVEHETDEQSRQAVQAMLEWLEVPVVNGRPAG